MKLNIMTTTYIVIALCSGITIGAAIQDNMNVRKIESSRLEGYKQACVDFIEPEHPGICATI